MENILLKLPLILNINFVYGTDIYFNWCDGNDHNDENDQMKDGE